MKFIYDHDFHIHSGISLCSQDTEQTPERILEYAKENGLKTICLTDHFWDVKLNREFEFYEIQNLQYILKSKPLPQADGIKFLFGGETDMDKFFTVGASKEAFDLLDFVIVPTTHLHMSGFTIKEGASIAERASLWVKRLEKLLNMQLPFHKIGIAHLACHLIDNSSRENYIKVLDMIKDEEMEKVFKKAAEVGCGIELNLCDMDYLPHEQDSILRMFKIAKKCGCKFYLGTDAHHPSEFEKAKEIFSRTIDLLELTEDDKFVLL